MGGEWISSLELEDIINLHPVVSEVAVIGSPDNKWGEKPLAFIVVTAGSPKPSSKDIVHHVKTYIEKGLISKLALLLSVRFVDSIKKTSVGKVDKKLLREKYL